MSDIQLPPLPAWMWSYTIPHDSFDDKVDDVYLLERMHQYGRAAVELDRQQRGEAGLLQVDLAAAQTTISHLSTLADRWLALRDVPDDLLGLAYIPCVAMPKGPKSGSYLNGADADAAVDGLIARLRGAQPAKPVVKQNILETFIRELAMGTYTPQQIEQRSKELARNFGPISVVNQSLTTEREAFEAWWQDKFGQFGKAMGNDYEKDVARRAWQARAALAQPTTQQSLQVAEPEACPPDVCQAAKHDGVLCADGECDRENGVRPAGPVGGESIAHILAVIEKYADAVTQYNEAVRIDVGADKAGADCLAIEKQLRALLARYGAQPAASAEPPHLLVCSETIRNAILRGNVWAGGIAAGLASLAREKDILPVAPVATQSSVPDDSTDKFMADVAAELKRARTKFPGDRIMTIALAEEFGELAKAMLDEPGANVWKEAVQTAVMAARVAVDGDSSVDEWRTSKGLDNHRNGGQP